MLITGLIGLASAIAPTVAGWLGGEDAKDATDKVVRAGLELAGVDNQDEAARIIAASPELMAKYKENLAQIELEFYREGTKRLETVNTTMRAEIAGTGTFKTGWRPAFGWVMAFSWGIVIFGIMLLLGCTVVKNPTDLADVIQAIGDVIQAMVPMWFVAMSVLGVAVYKRSGDKRAAVGNGGSAIGGAVSGFIDMLKGSK